MEEPFVDIHPDAAKELHIDNGDFVSLSTKYGKIRVRANLDEDLRKDCLRMTHGWAVANVYELTGLEHLDPISGFPWLRALPSRLEKEEDHSVKDILTSTEMMRGEIR